MKPRTIVPSPTKRSARCLSRLDNGETFTLDEYLAPEITHDEFWDALAASR